MHNSLQKFEIVFLLLDKFKKSWRTCYFNVDFFFLQGRIKTSVMLSTASDQAEYILILSRVKPQNDEQNSYPDGFFLKKLGKIPVGCRFWRLLASTAHTLKIVIAYPRMQWKYSSRRNKKFCECKVFFICRCSKNWQKKVQSMIGIL